MIIPLYACFMFKFCYKVKFNTDVYCIFNIQSFNEKVQKSQLK